MKRILKLSISFVFLLALFSFGNPGKKLNKLCSKIWKNQVVMLKQVSLPESSDMDITQLNEIWSNDEIVGYACYTTAFGCRIGGCAAPSNPNVESYETFDYIVIYDRDLNIIKVDVAEYGGQYGYEICRSKWLSQFKGENNGFKLEENIDGIAGATISASYLIDDLNTLGKDLINLKSTGAI